ncbi:MAG: hypothetical protein LC634_03075, partial [Sphingomonadales bacterium]|nr:hypothetical protein [Sphingomonadales bacterium]
MSEVGTNTELLVTCLHDMADGEEQLADRLGKIAAHATDERLSEAFGAIVERAAAFARRFHEAASAVEAPEPDADNIWMRGILDDAERDT